MWDLAAYDDSGENIHPKADREKGQITHACLRGRLKHCGN